ncbi:hypothetical protein BO71DRAFT_442089 [Aspergillus ellipticus CBS 707.79]|uniref:Uncharacterized protein n=1 Tax=Aspergillus ellipticus CBS 707.79 TaxID=1448320 RepID=A0A319D6W5_9EURO|nr:hypothetical protein BO71DRAFT_442089 [Aspergillus ellipticus CBS 707.79]
MSSIILTPMDAEPFTLGPPIEALQGHKDYVSWRRQVRQRLMRWSITDIIEPGHLRPGPASPGYRYFEILEQTVLHWLHASTFNGVLKDERFLALAPETPVEFMQLIHVIVCDISVPEASKIWQDTVSLGRLYTGPANGLPIERFVNLLKDRVELCNLVNFPITPLQAAYILFEGIECYGREAEQLVAQLETPLRIQGMKSITDKELDVIFEEARQLGQAQTPAPGSPNMDALEIPLDQPPENLVAAPDNTFDSLLNPGLPVGMSPTGFTPYDLLESSPEGM